jgi:molecular chaperone DnaK
MPQIEVTFDIDANGILHVSAKDLGTGKEQKITITASSGLNESEIKQMVKDAEVHADDDRKRREDAETRNMAENVSYQTEKLLKEHGEKIGSGQKGKAEAALQALRDAIKSGDTAEMKSKLEKLNAEMQAISAEMYSKVRPDQAKGGEAKGASSDDRQAGQTQTEGGGGSDKGDVIDADFEMVDDNGKKKR